MLRPFRHQIIAHLAYGLSDNFWYAFGSLFPRVAAYVVTDIVG